VSTAGGVTTTDGQLFTHMEHVDLARLVFKRFGHDPDVATAAWRRLLGNGTSTADFLRLVEYPEHTPHCEGECRVAVGADGRDR
jgi:hypothetical protein